MPKATLTLPDGTLVTIDGSPEEIQKVLALYGSPKTVTKGVKPPKDRPKAKPSAKSSDEGSETADIPKIVNLVKTCDEAEAIEKNILDRTAMVDRVLLPLYIVHEHLGNNTGLTSGEISRITRELGVPVSQPNASRTLSGTASKYVMGDKVRVKGHAVRYQLTRRGVQFLKSVITNTDDAK
jgi:hypothetical protein